MSRPTREVLPAIGAHSTTAQVLEYLVTELKLDLVAELANCSDPSQLAVFQGQAKAYCELIERARLVERKLTPRMG